MSVQEKNLGKKRGRPAIGPGIQINSVFRPEIVVSLDAWREAQPDKPSRAEAIRRLIEFGLRAAQGKPEKAKGAS